MTDIATRADYADALLSLRRAKNLLAWLLIGILALQLALFFTARYSSIFTVSSTQPASSGVHVLQYFVNGSAFTANLTAILLAIVLLLTFNVMLVGRLLGLSRVTSASLWAFVLIILIFPWQTLLTFPGLSSSYQIPGATYTWPELSAHARFDGGDFNVAPMKWWRFVGFPVVCLIVTFMVQSKSKRGLRLALGESSAPVAPDATNTPPGA